MARPSRQSYEKARREQLKREKRERKAEKKAAVAAARAAGKDPYAEDGSIAPADAPDALDAPIDPAEPTLDEAGAQALPATEANA